MSVAGGDHRAVAEADGAMVLRPAHRVGALTALAESLVEARQRAEAAEAECRQLKEAVASRDVIGQAKGILMERYKVTADTAFAMLRDASQLTNTKLRDIAAHLAATGQLPKGIDLPGR